MGSRKIEKEEARYEMETKFNKIVDWIQLIFGVVLPIYGMIVNNSIAIGIGGLLLLFTGRKINISFPFKNEKHN